jgi:hypothetical protein
VKESSAGAKFVLTGSLSPSDKWYLVPVRCDPINLVSQIVPQSQFLSCGSVGTDLILPLGNRSE